MSDFNISFSPDPSSIQGPNDPIPFIKDEDFLDRLKLFNDEISRTTNPERKAQLIAQKQEFVKEFLNLRIERGKATGQYGFVSNELLQQISKEDLLLMRNDVTERINKLDPKVAPFLREMLFYLRERINSEMEKREPSLSDVNEPTNLSSNENNPVDIDSSKEKEVNPKEQTSPSGNRIARKLRNFSNGMRI